MLTELLAAGVALVLLVFLSTIESAYESLSEVDLRVIASEENESSRTRFFRELLEHRQRFELMLILGTQLSIAAIAVLLATGFMRLGLTASLAITLVLVLVVVVLFRQLLPRLMSQNRPEATLWLLLPIFQVLYRPLSWLVTPISLMLRRARKPEPEEEANADDEVTEIQAYIDVGEAEGIIEEGEGELIQNIIEFSDTLVSEIMRPRPQIVAIESTATITDARRLIMESKYSRIPVYRESVDNIEGIVYVRDLLAFCEGDLMQSPVLDCVRPAYFIPESKPVRELLEEMQKAKIQMAMVIDEYGGVAGLVTVEDIIEEILGEIEDEDETAMDQEIVEAEEGSYLVDGSVEIRKVELLYGKEVEADDFTTVAGLIISELGHVPQPGEKLEYKGLRFEVVDADGKRISKVRLQGLGEAASPSDEQAAGHSTSPGT
jgi:CBS domain containing-hemolysin-like protein